MKKISLSIVSIMAVTALHAGTDGVNTKLKHGVDAKVIAKSVKSVDDLSTMFSEGKTSGQIRMFYVDRNIYAATPIHRNSTAIGGHLKYETAAYKGLSLATAFYTTQEIATFNYSVVDPSLLGTNLNSYSIIGEAYVNYDMSAFGTKSVAKLGYQRYDTPMIGSDDARMIPNTFEAYKLTNNDIKNLSLQLSQVMSVAYGSFSTIYSGGILGATAGYSEQDTGTGTYSNIGTATVGKSTNGITNLQAKYKAKNFHVTISDDYAWDLYNTLYVDAGVSWNCMLNKDVKPFVKGQVIKQNSVGGEYMKNVATSKKYSDAGSIDSLFMAIKVGVKYAGLTAYAAYSQTGANSATDQNNNPFKNAIVSQFGGMPAYTQGMVTRHQFLAGTKATKVAAAYSFKEHGVNLSTAVYYVSFDMDANSGYNLARTATEPGFDIKYYPASVKKLQLRFRGNFPRKFDEQSKIGDKGWDEYRLIANYNF